MFWRASSPNGATGEHETCMVSWGIVRSAGKTPGVSFGENAMAHLYFLLAACKPPRRARPSTPISRWSGVLNSLEIGEACFLSSETRDAALHIHGRTPTSMCFPHCLIRSFARSGPARTTCIRPALLRVLLRRHASVFLDDGTTCARSRGNRLAKGRFEAAHRRSLLARVQKIRHEERLLPRSHGGRRSHGKNANSQRFTSVLLWRSCVSTRTQQLVMATACVGTQNGSAGSPAR